MSPVGQVFFGGSEQQLVAPYAGNHAVQGGPVGGGAAGHVAKQGGVFAHLKQVQPGLPGGPFQFQHHLAAEADVFLNNRDGIPGQAALLALGHGGFGVFELELGQVFGLFQLQQGLGVAQLFFEGVGVSRGEGVGQNILSCYQLLEFF